jgi:hypothetical protein
MKQLLKLVVLGVLVVVMAAPAVAQEKEKKRKRGERPQRSAAAGLMNRLENAKLTDEQAVKIKGVVAKYEPKLKEIANALKLTPAQRKAVTEARKKAAEAGKSGKEQREAADAAMKLTDEQKELRKKQQAIQQEMQKAVVALLTPEQVKLLRAGMKRGGDAEKNRQERGKRRKKSDK